MGIGKRFRRLGFCCCSPFWLGGADEDVKQVGQQSVGRSQKERGRGHPSGAVNSWSLTDTEVTL